jgi:hypothetical protein
VRTVDLLLKSHVVSDKAAMTCVSDDDFVELLELLSPDLKSWAKSFARDKRLDAADIFQQALTLAWEKRSQLKAKEKAKAWLYSIMKNVAASFKREVAKRRSREANVAGVQDQGVRDHSDLSGVWTADYLLPYFCEGMPPKVYRCWKATMELGDDAAVAAALKIKPNMVRRYRQLSRTWIKQRRREWELYYSFVCVVSSLLRVTITCKKDPAWLERRVQFPERPPIEELKRYLDAARGYFLDFDRLSVEAVAILVHDMWGHYIFLMSGNFQVSAAYLAGVVMQLTVFVGNSTFPAHCPLLSMWQKQLDGFNQLLGKENMSALVKTVLNEETREIYDFIEAEWRRVLFLNAADDKKRRPRKRNTARQSNSGND